MSKGSDINVGSIEDDVKILNNFCEFEDAVMLTDYALTLVQEAIINILAEREQMLKEREKYTIRLTDEEYRKVIENAQMDIPEPMIELEVRQMADEFAQRMQMQGLSMEQYMQYTGLTSEKLLEEMKPNAEKKIKTRLVLEAVVDAEKIEVSAEELEAEYKKLADMYQMEVDKVKEIMGTAGEENMKKDIAVQKAVDVIADSAK